MTRGGEEIQLQGFYPRHWCELWTSRSGGFAPVQEAAWSQNRNTCCFIEPRFLGLPARSLVTGRIMTVVMTAL